MKNTWRTFNVERSYYFESHDKDGNIKSDAPSVEEWKSQVVAEWTDFDSLGADECLIAFHELDVYADTKEPKPLHVHGVVRFTNAHSEEAVAKLMKVSNRKNCQHCKNFSGSVQYLIHITQDAINDMKHIYPLETIQGYALDEKGKKVKLALEEIQKRMVRKTSKKKVEDGQIKSDLLSEVRKGQKIVSDVRDVYETDEPGIGLNLLRFQKDKSMYLSAEKEYLEDCAKFYQDHPHPMSLIYITGIGGTGKTQLARAVCDLVKDKRGVHLVGAPGKSTTFDFASLYSGQKVSFADEFKPESMYLEQFLSVFDSLNPKVVNSRNFEKPYFPDVVVFAASMSLEHFAYQIWKPYAHDTAKLGTRVRQNLMMCSTESDWHFAYLNSLNGLDIGNKFCQFRRRFAAYVVVGNNGFADIYIMDDKSNPPYSLLFPQDLRFPAKQPFIHYATCVYDVKIGGATFDAQKKHLAKRILNAVDDYYNLNGFVRPEDCPKPFDPNPKSDPDPEQDKQLIDLSEFVEISAEGVN